MTIEELLKSISELIKKNEKFFAENIELFEAVEDRLLKASDDYDEDSLYYSDDDDRDLFQEGKTPMTPELFRCVCKWFLLWGTMEGIFAACFVAMTWHLACRSN